MTTLITIAQAWIFIAYVVFIFHKYGILGSISTSTYHLKGGERMLFLLFLWLIAILNLFQGLGFWGFVSSAGLVFSGITIDHRKFGGRQFHYVGTVVGVLSAFIALAVIHGMFVPIILGVLAIAVSTKMKNSVWWAEIFLFFIIIASYFLR